MSLVQLIAVLIMVESGGDPHAIGDGGAAVGCLQIHVCVIEDVNRIYGTRFTAMDRYSEYQSKLICRLYLEAWGRHYTLKTGKSPSMEVYSRIWNGGPSGWRKASTVRYWEKVRLEIERSEG